MKFYSTLSAVFLTLFGAAAFGQPTLLKDLAQTNPFFNSSPVAFTKSGDNLYFMASSAGLFKNLWISDGTTSGTNEATVDEYATSFNVTPVIIPFNGNVLVGNMLGGNLYYSNGKADGEVKIIDDMGGAFAYGFNPQNSFILGDNLYFWMKRTNDDKGVELYKTDGTEAGTSLFMDFNSGTGDGWNGSVVAQHAIKVSDTKVYFSASNGAEVDIYKTDGTTAGTSSIGTFSDGSLLKEPHFYHTVVNGHAFIRSAGGTEIWSVDIANDDVTEFEAGATSQYQLAMWHMDDELYYTRQENPSDNMDLLANDGSTERTAADNYGTYDGTIRPLGYSTQRCEANGKIYFFHHTKTLDEVELWESDGTSAGTKKVRDEMPISGQGTDRIYTCGNRVFYFHAGNAKELFELDLTSYELKSLVKTGGYPFFDEAGGRAYFDYDDGTVGLEPHYLETCKGAVGIGDKGEGSFAETFKVYPNPSNGHFILENASSHRQLVSVYTSNGQLVKTMSIQPGTNVMNLSLKQGLYIIRDDSGYSRKLNISQ